MKLKPIKITIKPLDQVLREAGEAFTAAIEGRKYEKHEELSFDNLETLRKVLTPKRLELLHAIKQYQPDSVYELAGLVERNTKNVTEDLQYLQELGLISLQHSHEERERVKPLLEADRLQVEISI